MALKCVVRQINIAGKRKHVMLITWLGSGGSQSVVIALYHVGSLTVYDTKRQKDQL
jgi:spore maturation protein SpmB